VFADACVCPFCELRLRVCASTVASAPRPSYARLSRAARVAAGAALVGVAGCGSTTTMPPYGAPPQHDAQVEAGGDSGADAGAQGGAGGAAGPTDASPPDAAGDRSVVAIYGAAAPVRGKPVR